MTKRIILHVGMHKTGTTSIQNFFFHNKKKFEAVSVRYPVFSFGKTPLANHSWPIVTCFGENPSEFHLTVSAGISDKESFSRIQNHFFQELENAFSDKIDEVIISGEEISAMKPPELHKLSAYLHSKLDKGGKIDVICFARHPFLFASSAIQEMVRGGWSERIAVYQTLALADLRTTKIMNKLSAIFGPDNLIPVKFEDAISYEKGLEAFFIDRFLPNTKSHFGPSKAIQNASLSYEAYTLLKKLGMYHGRHDVISRASDEFRDRQAINGIRGSRFCLAESIQKDLVQRVSGDIARINEAYQFNYEAISGHNIDTNEIWSDSTMNQISSVINEMSHPTLVAIIDTIRDEAISLEDRNKETALRMLEFAYKYRPEGTFIYERLCKLKASFT